MAMKVKKSLEKMKGMRGANEEPAEPELTRIERAAAEQFTEDMAALEASLKAQHPEIYDEEIGFSPRKPVCTPVTPADGACCPIDPEKTTPGLVQTPVLALELAPIEPTKEEKASRTSIFVGV